MGNVDRLRGTWGLKMYRSPYVDPLQGSGCLYF
jgi:hypothetical protein